jgi:transposase
METKSMKKITPRSLGHDASVYIRQVFVRFIKMGISIKIISPLLLVATSTLYFWLGVWRVDGEKALYTIHATGPKPGPSPLPRNGRLLDIYQEQDILYLISNYDPIDPHCGKLDSAAWDRKTVRDLIRYRYDVTMSVQTVGRYLKRWGFTKKKLAKRAYEQNAELVEKFKNNTFPELVLKADKENAIIVFLDETGFNSNSNLFRGYSPRGKRCFSHITAKKFSKNVVISLDQNGKINFMSYDSNMNTSLYIKFLGNLLRQYKQKIYLIADNLRVHHAKKLNNWLEDKADKIELYYLPPYSPELNPVEYVNCHIKYQIFSKSPSMTKEVLEKRIFKELKTLQRAPKLAKKFFGHEELKYLQNT